MNDFKGFLSKAAADETAKKEIDTILGDKKLVEATDEQFAKIIGVAKKLGFDITAEEMKEFANGNMELEDEELGGVAGGWDWQNRPTTVDEWYYLASQAKKYAKSNKTDIDTAIGIVAGEHNVDSFILYANWSWFKSKGLL